VENQGLDHGFCSALVFFDAALKSGARKMIGAKRRIVNVLFG
jgi:hypothetical protein